MVSNVVLQISTSLYLYQAVYIHLYAVYAIRIPAPILFFLVV